MSQYFVKQKEPYDLKVVMIFNRIQHCWLIYFEHVQLEKSIHINFHLIWLVAENQRSSAAGNQTNQQITSKSNPQDHLHNFKTW